MRISTSQMQQQGVFSLLEQQAKLSKLQNQLATGKRMITPADDPAASARALDLEKSIGTLARYSENADRAEHRLQLEEAILDEVSTNLTRLRDLTLQANNATQDAAGRKMIGAEVDQILAHLVELANSSDGNGEHLFGGTRTKTEPFIASGGQVTYHGDQGQRMNQVGPSRQIASTHSGHEVFMSIPGGNGRYIATAGDNQGTVVVTDVEGAQWMDPPQNARIEISYHEGEPASISASLISGGESVDLGNVTLKDSRFVLESQEVSLGGKDYTLPELSVGFAGTPADGDTFSIEPSRGDSLFNIVQRLSDAMHAGGDSDVERVAFNNIANRVQIGRAHV